MEIFHNVPIDIDKQRTDNIIVDIVKSKTDATSGAGTAYPSGAAEFTPGF
jgi:hypothetical protein